MTKQDYTLYIYKADKRTKTGDRLFSPTVWTGQDDNGMRRTVANLFPLYRPEDGYRFDWTPAYKTVTNLMSGKEIQIPTDTPWCCNPASETYWSM